MAIQHSPPARQTKTQPRTQAVLTSTLRAPLDGTPEVPQLSAQLDRGPFGKLPGTSRTIFKGPGEDGQEEEENPVKDKESDGTGGAPAPVGVRCVYETVYNITINQKYYDCSYEI
ncbi:hypothetical protein O181_037560 [Austropuccinia psidii MF-1]|uniref:Uncharacterized protein n=1 Tax=Austropuccinia psidii MF-1 TaxID=1389203 RepID=A0A9Q3HD90_9BASI|nr:hypothetical protein [Austropuccinia psidii MF-1]